MARGATTRRKRTQAEARRRRQRAQSGGPSASVAEHKMFFVTLRRQAKWVFVFLALVFAVGFVVFGVGSGGGIGLGDLFSSNNPTNGNPSESSARKKIAANPKNADAYRELATALQVDGKNDAAIEALERYGKLRPKDVDALNQLASLYTNKALILQGQAQSAQAEAQEASAQELFGSALQPPKNQAPLTDPIAQAVSERANARLTTLYGDMQSAFSKAEDVYRKIAQLTNDPQAVLQLAQIAQQAGDLKTAISSYQRFIKLAPDDPSVPLVKQQIKALKNPQVRTQGG